MDDKLVRLSDVQNSCHFIQDEHGEWILAADIIKLPAVDAVDVVRCKDCIHHDKCKIRDGIVEGLLYNGICIASRDVVDMLYCPFGKRREKVDT